MNFLGLDISLFELLIIVNVLAVFFSIIVSLQALYGMRQETKMQFARQLKEQQKRKHEQPQHSPQDCRDDEPLVLTLPAEKEGVLKKANAIEIEADHLYPPSDVIAQIAESIGDTKNET